MRTYYLEPINDRAKSFYGKAKVIEKTNGDVELQKLRDNCGKNFKREIATIMGRIF